MALIACPECSKDVSDQARLCPHCGVNVQERKAQVEAQMKLEAEEKAKERKQSIQAAIIGIVIFLVIVFLQHIGVK